MWKQVITFMVLWLIALSGAVTEYSLGAASSSTSNSDEEWRTVLVVWQAAQMPRVRALRQATMESQMEEETRKRISQALVDNEIRLRQMISEARKDPARAADVLKQMTAYQKEQGAKIRGLFVNDQYEAVSRASRAIELQLSSLASDPEGLLKVLDDKLKLTDAQKTKIEPVINRTSASTITFVDDLSRASDPRGRVAVVIDGTERVVSAALSARSDIRAALTPQQLEQFDTGFQEGPIPGRVPEPAQGNAPSHQN